MSKLSYFIDTGAEVSVLPPRSEDRDRSPINNNFMQQQAANGTAIRTFGLLLDFSINFCVFAHFVCLEGAYVGPCD